MLVKLPYGKGFAEVKIPDQAMVVVPRELPGVADPRAEIRRAMDHPIGSVPLRQLACQSAQGRPDATIVIDDLTRPSPSDLMLAAVLEDLETAGIHGDQVTVLIACGSHRPNTPAEIRQMVGPELASRLRIVNHDCEDEANLTFVGETDTGFPVWINSLMAQAPLKILTGVVAPHHGAGYGGGRKSLIPGVAGFETIRRLHSFPISPYGPVMGWMKGNPTHEEIIKGARMVGIDFVLNVVRNPGGQVVQAVAGDLEAAHEAGVGTYEENWVIEFPRKYDVVVVTPGGYPRDINLHQAQKAMSAAEMVACDGGVIVLIAECVDGIGKFAPWFEAVETPQEVIERFTELGFTRDHLSKAFYCARALDVHPVIVACSGIGGTELERMFFRYAPSPQAAIDRALELKGADASLLVLPYATNGIPKICDGGEAR